METRLKWAYFCALVSVALVLGPSLAHLFELPNKIGLEQEAYFTVQAIYRGWALLGVVIAAALAATLVLALLLRRQPNGRAGAWIAFACLAAGQAVFWIFTFPANQATQNWTVVPDGWQMLRTEWEYSHAAGAALNLAAMVALVVSVLSRPRPAP